MKQLLPYLRRMSGEEPVDDARLLARFAAARDEAAFAALVRRHGPLVLGVCRRWLRNSADVDDAFQATFLVLVRRADDIAQPAQLACWLHGVARRTARSLRDRQAKRDRFVARNVDASRLAAPAVPDFELAPILDEEVNRLPDKYRLPVVLCHLQGLSRRDAARQLACPEGTLSVRLARALEILRRRLIRRGLAPAAVLCLLAPAASDAVSPLLLRTTVRAALMSAAPAHVVALTEGVLRMFLVQRLCRAAGFLLALCVALAGGTLLVNQLANGPAAHADTPAKPAPPPIVLTLKTTGDGEKIEQIDLTEGNDGRITVYALPMLERYLKRVRQDKGASDTVVIKAGKDTKYSILVGVLMSCRSAGFAKINMETPPSAGLHVDLDGRLDLQLNTRPDAGVELKWNLDRTELKLVEPQLKLGPLQRYELAPLRLDVTPGTEYRRLRLNYAQKMQTATNMHQVQREWIGELQKFIDANPKAPEASDAMLQLGLLFEFTGQVTEALTWYERLVKLFPAAREVLKARGSEKRLQSVGQLFDLDAATLNGQRFRIGNLKGKIVIVYYWASWNQAARTDFARLQALRNVYGERGLEVVCVNLDEKLADAKQMLQHSPLGGAIHVREDGGFDSRLANEYGINVLPTLFLLDREGKVLSNSVAPSGLEDEVKKLIK